MQLFRDAGKGHLVVVSSVSAIRGLPRAATAYSASKAGLATLAEGIRADLHGTGIVVTTLYPGYIRSELTARTGRTPFITDTVSGVRAMVRAIDREPATAVVPAWPWRPIGFVLRHAPVRFYRRFS